MEYKSPRVRMRDVSRIYDALEVGIIITTGSGTIIWGNRYYSQLAQFDIRDYFGHNVREISRREDVILPTMNYIIDIVLQTRQQQTEIVQYRTEDYVLTTATPIFDKNNKIDYIIYSITNYSELMRLREKVSESGMRVLALENHLRNLQVETEIGKEIIIANKEMYNIYGKALRLASTSVSVMLTGESGTGKDVLAKFIHQSSSRKGKNFIHVNMAAIPKPLFESELFGYTSGSFTGAARQGKEGLVQLANGGTLFLDEIGELPLDIQAKLLQVIQNKEVRAIGAVSPTPVDFRIICATNRDLRQMVNDHTFRLDLYHRLNAVELTIPPLRERRDDILPLATFFLNHFNDQNHTNKYLTSDVLHLFTNYSWPGNVRELQHVIEGAMALCPNDAITLDQLPMDFHVLGQKSLLASAAHTDGLTLKQAVEQLETQMIETALKNSSSAVQAAEKLGVDPSTLSKKRKRYGL
ncbi:MAG TPA: sigma 54-interacting transcriptional regulator [Candidatus Enterocloster excrementigallinarum]|uniref:Sigma 54-interacting transcriptional regulator n=1 Tax=Candidatus Enterocloster excrementigallinarum TaxID=2838558 RepID=A0A9D2PRL8_9FIRM|nr:sigma 54-interacting transcriptional regulator [Candidatus Enterocloster excrementigallinarum]